MNNGIMTLSYSMTKILVSSLHKCSMMHCYTFMKKVKHEGKHVMCLAILKFTCKKEKWLQYIHILYYHVHIQNLQHSIKFLRLQKGKNILGWYHQQPPYQNHRKVGPNFKNKIPSTYTLVYVIGLGGLCFSHPCAHS